MTDEPGRDKVNDNNTSARTLQGISAVTLATGDMARAVDFYRRLGFEVHHGGEAAAFTSFAVAGQSLNLIAASRHERWPWWGRVIFYVDDVDAFYENALNLGLHPSTQPRDAEWGERYFHLSDPDGHELSFAKPL